MKDLKFKFAIFFLLFYSLSGYLFAFLFKSQVLATFLWNLIVAIVAGYFYILHFQTKKKVDIKRFCLCAIGLIGIWLISQYNAQIMQEATGIKIKTLEPKENEMVLYYISSLLLSPIAEEFLFRGILFECFGEQGLAAILFSSICFGASHGSFPHSIAAALVGIFFCIVYVYSERLWVPILFHILFNLVAVYVTVDFGHPIVLVLTDIVLVAFYYYVIKYLELKGYFKKYNNYKTKK